MDIKSTIVRTAKEFGFQTAVVAGLSPMEAERAFFKEWIARGYAGTMNYLTRDPDARTTPALLCPEAYCAIVLFASYYSRPPEDPGPSFGKVARYAVGLDYHRVIPEKLEQLKLALEERLGRPLLGRYFTDDVQLFEQAFAQKAGLGFTGKNTMVIGPQLMGSYHFVCEFFTDLSIEPDEPYKGTCGKCFRCGDICPTGAIVEEGVIDARLCISYLTIENKGAIPENLRPLLGRWLFGCDDCQEICPYNQSPPPAIWDEFSPERGAGHFVDLYDLLTIKSNRQFLKRFRLTPLSRPNRKGLLRNALVVLGNARPESGPHVIHEFAAGEKEPLLREHAAWAISQYGRDCRLRLEDLLKRETDDSCRDIIEGYLRRLM